MKLIPGQTVIGKSVRKDNNEIIEFTVYYGNVLKPLIDGQVMHLNTDEYLKTLFDFLQSEEGKGYDRPTADEAQEACDMMKSREQRVLGTSSHLKIEKQVERTTPPVQPAQNPSAPSGNPNAQRPASNQNAQSTPRVQDTRNESPSVDYKSQSQPFEQEHPRKNLTAYEPKTIKPVDVDEYQRQIDARNEAEYQRRMAEQAAAMSEENDEVLKQLNKLNPKADKKKAKEEKPTKEDDEQSKPLNIAYDRLYKQLSQKSSTVKGLRVALIFVSTLLVVVLGLGIYLASNLNTIIGKDEAIIQINGQAYAIPIDIKAELENGESKLFTYGVAVTNSDGTISKSVIPFGEIGFDITSVINSDDVTFTPANKAKKEAANLQEEIKEAADQATHEENNTESVESTTEQSQPSENSEGE